MPYPFLFFAATPKTAFQHPCRSSIAAAFVAAPLFIPSAALAALNCTMQPTCAELGYSKSSVDGCEDYLYCPFDTSYKRCVKEKEVTIDCSDYPLSSCPSAAESCSACGNGTDISYKIDTCRSGYTLSGNSCIANSCSGYTLTSCPTNGSCSSCLSGTTTKYKLDSCADGYKISGSSCAAKTCADYGYYTLLNRVCNTLYRVKLGSSTGYCYANCKACLTLNPCSSGGILCYTSKTSSVSGYAYGTCTTYTTYKDKYSCSLLGNSAGYCRVSLD